MKKYAEKWFCHIFQYNTSKFLDGIISLVSDKELSKEKNFHFH